MATKNKPRKTKSNHSKSGRRWSHEVKTVSTFPPEGIFTKDAQTIARSLGSKRVSPKGIGSGIRMIQFFINRAGKNLSEERKSELEAAKRILQQRRQREVDRARRKKAPANNEKNQSSVN